MPTYNFIVNITVKDEISEEDIPKIGDTIGAMTYGLVTQVFDPDGRVKVGLVKEIFMEKSDGIH